MATGVRLPWGAVGVGLLLLAASVGLTSWLLLYPTTPPAPASDLPRDLEVVAMGHVDVEGGVASLYPLQSGRVVAIAVEEGQAVEKGAELLKIDDRQARLRVLEAQKALAAAQEQLAEAEKVPDQHRAQILQQTAGVSAVTSKAAAAKFQLEKHLDLRKLGQITDQEVSASRELVAELEALVTAEASRLEQLKKVDPAAKARLAKIELESVRIKLTQAEEALKDCVLCAPQKGRALRVVAKVGDLHGPGMPLPAIEFCPDRPLIVRAEAEQEYASRLKEGAKASIQDDAAVDEHRWTGTVERVSDWVARRRSMLFEPNQMNDVRTVEVIVRVAPDPRPLRIGQRVRVMIHGGTPADR